MIQIRPSEERGKNRMDWLDTKFSFFVRSIITTRNTWDLGRCG